MRGVLRNRVIGDGIAYANAEFRWKFYRTRLLNQQFYFGLNAFYDMGIVTKKMEVDPTKINTGENRSDYFNPGAEKLHSSVGLGLKIAMNENFVISVDYGKALNEQDGNSGIYIGLNYMF